MKRLYILSLCAAVILSLIGLTACKPEKSDNKSPSGSGSTSSAKEEPIGGDWRVQRGYTEDFVLSDNLTVCFSPFSDSTGYGVYEAVNGGRIGSLVLSNSGHDTGDTTGFQIADHNGDGDNDIGISLTDGTVIWYGYNPEVQYEDNGTGGFYLIK